MPPSGQPSPALPNNVPHPGDNIVPGNFVPNNPYYVGLTLDPMSGRPRPINPGEQPMVWYHSFADGTGAGQYEGNLSQWFRMGGGSLRSGTGITDPNYGKTAAPTPAPTGNNWGGVNSQIATNTANSANAPLLQGRAVSNNYLSPTQTNQALTAARDAYMRDITAMQQAGQTSWAKVLDAQGAWQNALLTQAAKGYQVTPGWVNYMYGPQNPWATYPSTGPGAGFYLQNPYPVSVDTGYSEPAAPTPGLTGGILGTPLWNPYNGGNVSTQVSGQLLTPPGGQNYVSPAPNPPPSTAGITPADWDNGSGGYVSEGASTMPGATVQIPSNTWYQQPVQQPLQPLGDGYYFDPNLNMIIQQ